MNHFTFGYGYSKLYMDASLTWTSLLALNSIMDRKASTSRQILSLLLAMWGRTLLTKSWVLIAFCTSLICPSWLQILQKEKKLRILNLQRRVLHVLLCSFFIIVHNANDSLWTVLISIIRVSIKIQNGISIV